MTQVEKVLGRCPVRVGAKLRGRYEVLQAVARGTRGVVFLAQRCTAQRHVGSPVSDIIKGINPKDRNEIELEGEQYVLKVSDGDSEFRNEVWMTANDLHYDIGAPEVTEVFPLVRQPWTVCVMECLGPNIGWVWEKYVKDEHLCRIGIESLLRGLDVAHRLNIVHCDVQPANICESPDGTWRLVDWGDAEHLGEKLVQGLWGSGQRGACCYQSPEMLSDTGWGLSCDVWSLAITVVEIFLGQVWDDDHRQLFDLPDVCGQSILDQMEKVFGRLPDWLRMERQELDKYGDPEKFFLKFPPLLADLLMHLLVYEPSERMSVSEALLHPWFQNVDPVRWVDSKLKEAKATKSVTLLEQRCINASIQQMLDEHDFKNADILLHRCVELRLQLSSDAIGTNLLGCFESSKYKKIDYWLGVLKTEGLSLSERVAFQVVLACARFRPRDAAGFMYTLEHLGTELSSRMFTELIASSSGPDKVLQMEKHLDGMLKRGLNPESKAIVILFEAYSVSYPVAQSNRRAPRYTIRSMSPPPLSTQNLSQSRSLSPGRIHNLLSEGKKASSDVAKTRASAMQVRQAETTLQNLLVADPPILLDRQALEAIYAAVGEQRLQIFQKEPNWGRRLQEAVLRSESEEKRLKEEAVRLEEERIQKENARSELLGLTEGKPSDEAEVPSYCEDDGDLEPIASNPKRKTNGHKPFLRSSSRKPWTTKSPKVTGWR